MSVLDKIFDWDAYGRDVMSGVIVVCKWTRLAVERHYDDLKTCHERGLYFSEDLAQHALQSFLYLRHSKGEWAGKQFVPDPWQQFWIALLFGWMRADGTRRFREFWLEVPRKNGKTTVLAGIGIYLFYWDGEGGSEVYAAGTKLDQAKIMWSEADRMIASSPLLKRRISSKTNTLYIKGKADAFVPLGRDSKSLDGLNPHGAILDEVHAHPNGEIHGVLKTGMGARRQPLLAGITTAGFDLSSFGYEQHIYATKVLDGVVSDDELLAVIYTVDDPDKWDCPIEQAKANPGLGTSVYPEGLKLDCERAIRQPSAQPNFKTKNLNIWLSGGEQWIAIASWRTCANEGLRLEDFEGEDCWIGIDLAEKSDVAATCHIFNRGKKMYVFFHFYLNEYEVAKPENSHYQRYQQRGELVVTEGNATDFDVIYDDLIKSSKRFNLVEVPYDRRFAAYFATKLVEEGLPMVEIPQTATHFTAPIVEIENKVLTGDLEHEGNTMMEWMMSNVVMRVSKFSGLKHPTKETNKDKIDGPVAMLMAAGRALANESDEITQGFVEL